MVFANKGTIHWSSSKLFVIFILKRSSFQNSLGTGRHFLVIQVRQVPGWHDQRDFINRQLIWETFRFSINGLEKLTRYVWQFLFYFNHTIPEIDYLCRKYRMYSENCVRSVDLVSRTFVKGFIVKIYSLNFHNRYIYIVYLPLKGSDK